MTPVIETEPILPVHLMESIVNGNHGRPYDVLGPHPVDDGEEAGAVVRVFLPYATQVTLVAAEQEYACNQIHSGGLFEVFVPLRPPFSYQLRVLTDRGDVITVEDPYRFPLTLSDYDTYLMGEGTHMKIYEQ